MEAKEPRLAGQYCHGLCTKDTPGLDYATEGQSALAICDDTFTINAWGSQASLDMLLVVTLLYEFRRQSRWEDYASAPPTTRFLHLVILMASELTFMWH